MKVTPYARMNLASSLSEETLSRSGLLSEQDSIHPIRISPELSVVKIGGHGVIDYGKKVVLPLADEIRRLAPVMPLLIMTGGGVRVRHIMDLGVDLGMPTGILASFAGKISEQNALMLSVLLSDCGAEYISNTDLLKVPNMFRQGILPVAAGTPPYGLYELPPESGILPQYRTDSGAVVAAELLGAKSCILVKNCAGLFDKNPFIYEDASLIPEISASELLEMKMDDMVLEQNAVEILADCKNLDAVKIINGHNPGELTSALTKGTAGTVIRRK